MPDIGSPIDIETMTQSLGRRETADTVIAATPAAALAATLDHDRAPIEGEPLPPLWHWLYFVPLARHAELGADGHPRLGGFLPQIPLPRRMWAGGRLRFHHALRIGERVTRETRISAISEKLGKEGPLLFVTLSHDLHGEAGLAIEETQELVYRGAAPANRPVAASIAGVNGADTGRGAQWHDAWQPDAAQLFRYSALTFNAHRIHYDLAYAQTEEGYRERVVQGPFTATALADRLAVHNCGTLCEFSFRGQSPLFCGEAAALCGVPGADAGSFELWAEGPGGVRAMTATARLGSAP